MTCITIPHNTDLMDKKLWEFRQKTGYARRRTGRGQIPKTAIDWGKFKHLNTMVVDYLIDEYVLQNKKIIPDYIPIRKERVTLDKDIITIACLGIKERFELPPDFGALEFVHVHLSHMDIYYKAVHSVIGYQEIISNVVFDIERAVENNADDMTAEERNEAVKKLRYVVRWIKYERQQQAKKRIRDNP